MEPILLLLLLLQIFLVLETLGLITEVALAVLVCGEAQKAQALAVEAEEVATAVMITMDLARSAPDLGPYLPAPRELRTKRPKARLQAESVHLAEKDADTVVDLAEEVDMDTEDEEDGDTTDAEAHLLLVALEAWVVST
jgi:hypothetical protein